MSQLEFDDHPSTLYSMRRCFFLPNQTDYLTEWFPPFGTTSCYSGDARVTPYEQSLIYWSIFRNPNNGNLIPPFYHETSTTATFYSFAARLKGPTGPPGYYPFLLKEGTWDSNCIPRNWRGGNSLVNVNQYSWACLTSKPPKIVPGQVFYLPADRDFQLKILLEDLRGDRIPENVTLRYENGFYAANWNSWEPPLNPPTLSQENDWFNNVLGIKFLYNTTPRGFQPDSFLGDEFLQPRDSLRGDYPFIFGKPLESAVGRHTLVVRAFNQHGISEETITVVITPSGGGVSISLKDWTSSSPSLNAFPMEYSGIRSFQVLGTDLYPLPSPFPGSNEQNRVLVGTMPEGTVFNPDTPPTILTIWEITKCLPSGLPDETIWGPTQLLPTNLDPNVDWNYGLGSGKVVDEKLFIRAKGPRRIDIDGTEEFKGEIYAVSSRDIRDKVLFDREPISSFVFGIDFQLLGDHLFTAVFPLYCNVATAGPKAINRKVLVNPVYVSVNGGDPFEITADSKLNFNAGWNRAVFVITNASGPVASLVVDDIEGVTSWWSPASLKNCIGKKVSQCIPAVTSSSGLENLAKGMLFYNIGRESALNVEQNAFPYMPVNQIEFPFATVGEAYRQQPNLRDILHLHNNWRDYENRLKTQSLPGYNYIIRPDLARNRLEFYHDARPGRTPPVSPIAPWNLTQDATVKCRMVYFQVSMAAQIRQNSFSTSSHSVELRGEFSGWEPIPGVLLPVNGSTDGSSVYHFLAYIQGEPGATLKYKFKATNSLDWESIPDRTFQLGPEGGNGKTLQVIPRASFNNAITSPLLLGSETPLGFYVGNSPVSKIYHGGSQIYP